MPTQTNVIARNVINLNGDEEDFGMTANVDPNEAWLDEILDVMAYNLKTSPDEIFDKGVKANAKQAILAKLHEADQAKAGLSATASAGDVVGELERELTGLPKTYTRTVAYGRKRKESLRIVASGSDWGAGYAGTIYVYGDTPLAAVRALRKKLEEEGIC